jgi:phosphohistidine phosphatase
VSLVTLLRHAHSDHPPGTSDHARPLDERGRCTADAVGRWHVAAGVVPDLVLVSSARRTVETVERAVAAGGWDVEVRVTDALYLCDVGTVLEQAAAVLDGDGAPDHLLLVGHEPTWSATVRALSGASVSLATGSLACVEVPSGSGGVGGGGVLRWVVPGRIVAATAGRAGC